MQLLSSKYFILIFLLLLPLILGTSQHHEDKKITIQIQKSKASPNMNSSPNSLINRINNLTLSNSSPNLRNFNHKLLKNAEKIGKSHLQQQMHHLVTSIRLETQYGFIYYGDIHIGSEKSLFSVLFDTGSTILWLTDISCSTCQNVGITNHFDCSSSSTCQQQERNVKIQYGIGLVNGHLEQDDISLGNLVASQQMFIDIYEMEDLPHIPAAGLIGLNIGSESGIQPLLNTLKDQEQIDSIIFSMYLTQDQESYLIIGGTENKFKKEEFRYCPNIAANFWAVEINEVKLSGGALHTPLRFQNRDGDNRPLDVKGAVIDSGSSVLIFPQNIVEQILEELKLVGIECTFQSQKTLASCNRGLDSGVYPDMYLKLCGQEFQIPAKQYIIDNGDQGGVMKIMKSPQSYGIIILGDTFMQEYYTVFDQDNMRIGFALSSSSRELPVEKRENLEQQEEEGMESAGHLVNFFAYSVSSLFIALLILF